MPDFAEKYAAGMVAHAKASGASQEKIDETTGQAEDFVRNYHKPAYRMSMTFVEVFPVFLAITLLSAVILRRKAPVTATS